MIWRASVPASRLPLCGRMISGFTAEHREGQASACPAAHAPPTPAVPAVPAVPAAIWSARDKLRAVRGGAPRRPPLVPAHLRVRGGAPRRPPLVPAHLRVRGARHRFPSAPRAEGSPSLPILPGLRILRVPLRARLSSGGAPRRHPIKIVALLVLLTPVLDAEVFWRIPSDASATLRALGGARVYATDVEVNGAPGTLAAYAFNESPATLSQRLSHRFNLASTAARPSVLGRGSACMITHASKNSLQRLLVLPSPASRDDSVVLAFEQSLRNAAATRQQPPAWPDGLPVLNATPRFTALCAKTRTRFVTADADATPEAAVQDAARILTGAGWSETTPTTPTFKLFVSGRKQCLIFAHAPSPSDNTQISLLQREGATP